MPNQVRFIKSDVKECFMALLSSGSISKSDVLPLFDAAMARFELINFISRRVLVDKPHPRFGNVKAIETLHFNHTGLCTGRRLFAVNPSPPTSLI
jgi:hypothetical protein